MQRLPTRCQDREAGARVEEPGEVRRDAHDLLEVVEHQQQLALAQVIDQRATQPERGHYGRFDELRIADDREIDERRPVVERRRDLGGRLEREARLADSARADDGDQACALRREGTASSSGFWRR